jgi:hypothetical protein
MRSKRQYLTLEELAEYADITINDNDEAYDQISQAEELIDGYVGYQVKSVPQEVTGLARGATSNTLQLETLDSNTWQNDYFLYCHIKIIGGTGSGQERTISGSTYEGVITISENWTTTPDNTSFYLIYQVGKFPRYQDMHYYASQSPYRYFKHIVEPVKRATAAQVQYMIEMGSDYFSTDKYKINSEQIGDYRYQKAPIDGGSLNDLIAPKARAYLRGIRNIKGSFYVE